MQVNTCIAQRGHSLFLPICEGDRWAHTAFLKSEAPVDTRRSLAVLVRERDFSFWNKIAPRRKVKTSWVGGMEQGKRRQTKYKGFGTLTLVPLLHRLFLQGIIKDEAKKLVKYFCLFPSPQRTIYHVGQNLETKTKQAVCIWLPKTQFGYGTDGKVRGYQDSRGAW